MATTNQTPKPAVTFMTDDFMRQYRNTFGYHDTQHLLSDLQTAHSVTLKKIAAHAIKNLNIAMDDVFDSASELAENYVSCNGDYPHHFSSIEHDIDEIETIIERLTDELDTASSIFAIVKTLNQTFSAFDDED